MPDLMNPITLQFIRDVGFPITLVLILLSALGYMVQNQKDEKKESDIRYYDLLKDSDDRYEKMLANSDERYDKLLDKFILEVKDISNKHDDALKDISNDLKETINKLNNYMEQREFMASKVLDEINIVKDNINDLEHSITDIKDCIRTLHPDTEIIDKRRFRVPKEYR